MKKFLITLAVFVVIALLWYFGYYIDTPDYLIGRIEKKCPTKYTKSYLESLTSTTLKELLKKC